MTREDIIVLCENSLDTLEQKQGDWIGVVMNNLEEIRAYLVNQGD